jgi:hypothetical protein
VARKPHGEALWRGIGRRSEATRRARHVVEPGPFRTNSLGRSSKLARRQLPDYATTAGKAREYLKTQSGKQPGDPQNAVEAIITAANSPKPPLHFILGGIALARFRHKLSYWHRKIAAWQSVTTSADFPENKSSAANEKNCAPRTQILCRNNRRLKLIGMALVTTMSTRDFLNLSVKGRR